MANIKTLIDKQDNFELIRDEVAAILAVETAGQKVLAIEAGKNPDLWDFAIYVERSNPWNILYDSNSKIIKDVPLVNVFFTSESSVGSQSDPINQTKMNGQVIIDALSGKTDIISETTGGMQYGDELAARDVQRIIKLVRNILMSGIYTYIFTSIENDVPIAVKGIVTKRSFSEIQVFTPDINDRPAGHIIGARMTLNVEYAEFSPQQEGVTLDTLFSRCTRTEDGSIYFDAEFDTTI